MLENPNNQTTDSKMRFKVMQYNVLADFYHGIRRLQKLSAEFNLRFPRIKRELKTSDSDILFLQETWINKEATYEEQGHMVLLSGSGAESRSTRSSASRMVDLPASFGPWTITTPVSGRFSSFRSRCLHDMRDAVRVHVLDRCHSAAHQPCGPVL